MLKPEEKSGLVTLQRITRQTVTHCNSAQSQPDSLNTHSNTGSAESAALNLLFLPSFSSVTISNGFVVIYQGRLAGVGGEDLPTIVVVAHYDSFGVAPVRSLLLFSFK